MKNAKKWLLLALIIGLVIAFFAFDLKQYLTFTYLKEQKDTFIAFYEAHPVATIAGYMLIYISVTALSLPGAAIMTLAGGAIFGLVLGTVLVSFASSIGATLAFLVSRYLLGESIQAKFSDRLEEINKGIERDGAMYLFTLRLIPAVPFFVINVVMGLTSMRALTFYAVSQLGMLPGTVVFINAGTQLAQLDSASGILSPKLIFSFVLLGLFPMIVKRLMGIIRPQKAEEISKDDSKL